MKTRTAYLNQIDKKDSKKHVEKNKEGIKEERKTRKGFLNKGGFNAEGKG